MKKAVSPIIATVLLIAMVMVIAAIIFLWFKGMTEETITKFSGENIKLVCEKVDFDASYSDGNLYVSNLGNVPIFGMKLKIYSQASHLTKDLTELDDSWNGLNQGDTFSTDISGEVIVAEKIIVIPVLLGMSDEGEKSFKCEDKDGKEIYI